MKKNKKFTLEEVKADALYELEKRHFGGCSPSDIDSNWNWGTITESYSQTPQNVYGIWLRFKELCYSVSFSEIGYIPVFDENNRITHYFKG